MKIQFNALGTSWWIEVFDTITAHTLESLRSDIESFANDYENRYSRFKPDSLVSRLNHERVLFSPDDTCISIFTYAKQLYMRSNTKFNVLTGHILEGRGYDARYSFTPNSSAFAVAGNPITDLDISTDEIRIHQGTIDFGGFGKGYLIDLLVEELQTKYQLTDFLVNGGGDMFGATHTNQPIDIFLEHPTIENTTIYQTTITNQGFAASSPFKRRWKMADGETSHIVSQTDVSETGNFVKAVNARDADAFATASLLMTPREIEQLAKTEQIGFAQFSPSSNQLTGNKLFFE